MFIYSLKYQFNKKIYNNFYYLFIKKTNNKITFYLGKECLFKNSLIDNPFVIINFPSPFFN